MSVLRHACAAVLLAACGSVQAQAYPAKPIELVVHTGPGGGADLVARTIADIVAREKLLPQPIIVQNRSGGGGAIAQNYHVHATAENLGEILPHWESGKMHLLGVPAERRLGGMPNVPTLKEQGLDLHVGSGRGFAAPAGIPKDSAVLLEQTIARRHKSTGWREYMARNMYEDVYLHSEEFGRHLASRQPEMLRFLSDMGLAQAKSAK